MEKKFMKCVYACTVSIKLGMYCTFSFHYYYYFFGEELVLVLVINPEPSSSKNKSLVFLTTACTTTNTAPINNATKMFKRMHVLHVLPKT